MACIVLSSLYNERNSNDNVAVDADDFALHFPLDASDGSLV